MPKQNTAAQNAAIARAARSNGPWFSDDDVCDVWSDIYQFCREDAGDIARGGSAVLMTVKEFHKEGRRAIAEYLADQPKG